MLCKKEAGREIFSNTQGLTGPNLTDAQQNLETDQASSHHLGGTMSIPEIDHAQHNMRTVGTHLTDDQQEETDMERVVNKVQKDVQEAYALQPNGADYIADQHIYHAENNKVLPEFSEIVAQEHAFEHIYDNDITTSQKTQRRQADDDALANSGQAGAFSAQVAESNTTIGADVATLQGFKPPMPPQQLINVHDHVLPKLKMQYQANEQHVGRAITATDKASADKDTANLGGFAEDERADQDAERTDSQASQDLSHNSTRLSDLVKTAENDINRSIPSPTQAQHLKNKVVTYVENIDINNKHKDIEDTSQYNSLVKKIRNSDSKRDKSFLGEAQKLHEDTQRLDDGEGNTWQDNLAYAEAYHELEDIYVHNLAPGIGKGKGGKNALCFCAGTFIRKAHDDDIPIEELRIGDKILTSDGARRSVKNIEKQTFMFNPSKIDKRNTPICLSRDALSRGVPYQDLYVSPAHGIGFLLRTPSPAQSKKILIRAGDLVNHTTISYARCCVTTYYHIVLAQHALLIANGAYAKSFLDNHEKHAQHDAARGKFSSYQPFYPSQKACIPRVRKGKYARGIKKYLKKRAEEKGQKKAFFEPLKRIKAKFRRAC